MGRPLRIEYAGAVYHITSRGNERRDIFLDDEDRITFLRILKDYHDRFGILIHSYVLMGNHYHLILETPKGNLLKVMHGINSRYTAYFNRRHNRAGHLYQGRYKAIIIDRDNYLIPLSRYVHLNPVKANIVQMPEQYKWSSYPGYIGKSKEDAWIEYSWVLSKFSENRKKAGNKYKEYVEEGLKEKIESPLGDIWGQLVLGGGDFREKIMDLLKGQPIGKEIVQRKRFDRKPSAEEIMKVVANVFRVEEKDIKRRGRGNIARAVAIYIMQRYSGKSNEEIGKIFGGIHYSAVSKTLARLKEKMEDDKKLLRFVNSVISNVKT